MRLAVVFCLGLFASNLWAVIESYDFSTPELERRYQLLSAELRCPRCQNQNIADSTAPIAQDLRRLLHQQLEAGASDEEILAFMVERYGEFVRYRPKVGGSTLILWLAPVVLLLLAIVVVYLAFGRRTTAARQGFSEEDQQQFEQLLHEREERQ